MLMLELELLTALKPFNHHTTAFLIHHPPFGVRHGTPHPPRRARTRIIHLGLMRSQYPKLNFSYQSVLFSYDFFLIESGTFG
jgi:hypothetical protein